MSKNTLILGTRKGLLTLKKQGNSWVILQEHMLGIPFSYAMQDHRTGTIWACADHGHWGQKLYRSRDGGETMEEVPAPQYPEDAILYDVWNDFAEKPATITYLWKIIPGGDDQPQRLYIGSEPGGIFQSDDGGETFYLNEGLWNHPSRRKNWMGGGRDQAGSSSIVIDPRDSNHLYVGVSVGGVYESVDGGKTWEGRNNGLIAEYLPNPTAEYGHDPHFIAASPSNPDVLWQQNHCGVFRSIDRSHTWINVSQGQIKFGFPIALDEKDDQTAWVIPAISDDIRMAFNGALCVARTEDGGQTWIELRNGLPQKHCYDIVFRHALDISGDTLVFGSTTGNLFISEDRGDSWQSLGHSYPPIYSVRFA